MTKGLSTPFPGLSCRRFFCEARDGVMADLLLRVLGDSGTDSAIGEVAEEMLWSCWTAHDDEQARDAGRGCPPYVVWSGA